MKYLLFVLALMVPAQAEIRFATSTRLEARLRAAYARFPQRGKDKDITYHLVKRLDKNRFDGWYDGQGNAYIKTSAGLDIYIHEYGHHYWYQALTAAERAAWTSWWKRNKRASSHSRFKESAGEAWAISFEYYYSAKPMKDYWRRKTSQFLK